MSQKKRKVAAHLSTLNPQLSTALRQRQTLTDNSYTTYAYDNDAQLTNSLGYTPGGTPMAGQQLAFVYDAGWNMTNRSVNGTAATYTVNDLNQVTSDGVNRYSYDGNGNRTNKGGVYYNYDEENRLVEAFDSVAHSFRTTFVYDGLSRMRLRTDYSWTGSFWYPNFTTYYIYDGKRVVQERVDGTPTVAYTRGKDLSGSLEGAGGIGGLLARSHGYSGGAWSTHSLYHADGNGNITCMINSAATPTIVATYRYDPYGRLITSSGSLASANVYRFSSKEYHANTGLYYYLYRCYDPGTQRWLGRDPFQEQGGVNLYAFIKNRPTIGFDPFGLIGPVDTPSWPPPSPTPTPPTPGPQTPKPPAAKPIPTKPPVKFPPPKPASTSLKCMVAIAMCGLTTAAAETCAAAPWSPNCIKDSVEAAAACAAAVVLCAPCMGEDPPPQGMPPWYPHPYPKP